MAGFFESIGNFLTGSPEKHKRQPTLLKSQMPLLNQLTRAGQGQGAGGAFGDSADYYRNLLGDNSADFQAFAAPQMRQFNEEIIPQLSEQFAGMGSGGLSSSGFRNAAVNAGTDLSERLGAIRAQLRQQGAQGLQNIGQMGLGNYSQDVMTQPGTQGFLPSAVGAVGTGIFGPAIGALGNAGSNWLSNSIKGTTSPYGNRGGRHVMSYNVKQGNVFGRIGSELGKGLSEQLPKEFERNRLASGLSQFEKESGNLTPIQQLARLSSIPGITPQMIQSFGELARQQAKGNALRDFQGQQNQPKPSPFPQQQPNPTNQQGSNVPSLTKEEPFAKFQEGYIPRSQDQILSDAGRKYNENPALFGNDSDKAIANEEIAEQKNKDIAQAYQTQHQNLSNIQDNVVKRLQDHSNKLGVQIPANTYSKIEDDAIQATKPKKQGGRGLTEQQAMKEYGEKLDKISRDYNAIKAIGNWKITDSPNDVKGSIISLRNEFKKNNDLENFADSLVSKAGFSYGPAYTFALPVKDYPEINNIIQKAPKISSLKPSRGFPELEDVRGKTIDLTKKIAPLLKKTNASPLAISEELNARGYDGNLFLDILGRNKDKLDLGQRQGRELDKPRASVRSLTDMWLLYGAGLDSLAEIK